MSARFSLSIEALSNDALEEAMASHLRERGYVVEKARQWEKPWQFCQRLGICGQTFIRKTRDPNRPHVYLERSKTGRVLGIASNSLFDAFCLEHKTTQPRGAS